MPLYQQLKRLLDVRLLGLEVAVASNAAGLLHVVQHLFGPLGVAGVVQQALVVVLIVPI